MRRLAVKLSASQEGRYSVGAILCFACSWLCPCRLHTSVFSNAAPVSVFPAHIYVPQLDITELGSQFLQVSTLALRAARRRIPPSALTSHDTSLAINSFVYCGIPKTHITGPSVLGKARTACVPTTTVT